jgi:Bifunctional DNA primase/polymerase, N-terminal
MTSNLFAPAALQLAERGKPIFPLKVGGKTPAIPRAHPPEHPCRGECGRDGHGFYDATTDPDRLRAWGHRWPDANIGLATGRPSGLFVLDVDPAHDGMRTLAKMIATGGDGLDTLEVETGSGGVHLYLAMPEVDLTNSNAAIKARYGPGVDCRGSGGYVVAPPSIHPSGGRYSWGAGRLRPVPGWLVEVLTAPEPAKTTPTTPARVRSFNGNDRLLARFNGLLADVASETEGNRNQLLYWAACRLREYQAEGAPEGWTELLVQAGAAAGLTEAEARRSVHSGLRGAVS